MCLGHLVRSSALIWALHLCLAAGCGMEDSGSVTAAGQGSMDDLRPELLHGAVTLNGVHYSCKATEPKLLFSTEESSFGDISLSGLAPHLLVGPGTAGGTGELWVVGHDTTTGHIKIVAYTDQNSDGVVQSATATLLVTASAYINASAHAFDPLSGTLYILDSVSGDVYRAIDTTADHRPDSLDVTPLVAGSWDPNEPEPQFITYIDPDTSAPETHPAGLTAQATHLWRPTPTSVYVTATPSFEIGTFTDTDADGVADAVSSVRTASGEPPRNINGPLVAGMIAIEVYGSIDANVELREVDENGVPLSTLASTVLAQGSGFIQLSTPLEEGMLVRLVDTSNNLEGVVLSVDAQRFHVDESSEGFWLLDPDVAGTLTWSGSSLDQVASVLLREHSSEGAGELSLTFQVAGDGRSISVDVPVLGDSWDGRAIIVLCDAGGDECKHMFGALCKEGDAGGSGGSGGGG